MKRGFTLLEILVCIGILAALVGILLPVFASAKHQAKIASSMSNLHQQHIALKLYQVDYDCDGVYGTQEEMGFPLLWPQAYQPYGMPDSILRTPCGQDPEWWSFSVVVQYELFPSNEVDPLKLPKMAQLFQENLPTFIDMNCTDDFEDLRNSLFPHRGLGVLLSGQLVDIKKPGSWQDPSWWSSPPGQ